MKIILVILISMATSTYANACNYGSDDPLQKKCQECKKDKSKDWSSELNRCVNSQKSVELREKYKKCETIENEKERSNCKNKVTSSESPVKKGEGADDLTSFQPIHGIPAAFGLMTSIGIFGASGAKGCISGYIFMGASAMHLVTHFYLVNTAKTELEKLQDEYKSFGKDNKQHKQVESLEILKREQDLIADLATKRKNAYMLMSVAYGSALATALVEMHTDWLKPCSPGTLPSSGFLSKFPGIATKVINLNTSKHIAIWSGVSLGLTAYLAGQAGKQAEEAKKNSEELQKIIDQFRENIAGYCVDGRDDISNPRCYCYNSDKTQNKNRSKSNICQDLWKADNVKLKAKAKNYEIAQKSSSAKGCMFENGLFDANCTCKSKKKSNGENTCLKISVPKSGISQVSSLNNALKGTALAEQLNKFNNGANNGLGSLTQNSLTKQAARTQKVYKQLWEKFKKGEKIPDFKGDDSLVNNAIKKYMTTKSIAASKDFMGQTHGPSSNVAKEVITNIDNPKLDNLKKSLFKKEAITTAPSKRNKKANSIKPNDLFSSLSLEDTQNNVNEATINNSNLNNQDLTKVNDINKSSSKPIWEIISKRYMTSGIRYLFSE